MSLNYYQYDNTYTSDSCNNIFSVSNPPKGDIKYCSNYAFNNKSPFFILTDYDKTTNNSSCIIKDNTKTNVTDKQINKWINSLKKCDTLGLSDVSTCYDICNSSHYGGSNGYSIYLNPSLTTNGNLQLEDVSFGEFSIVEFTNIFSTLVESDFPKLSDDFTAYRKEWYNDVSINDKNQIYLKNDAENNKSVTLYDNQLSKVRKNLYNLYNIQSNIEAQLSKFDNEYQYYQQYIKIVNEKLENSQKFFNSLMNKNQGALGALDDSIYNTNSIITDNIVMVIIILISIFVYFKYIIN